LLVAASVGWLSQSADAQAIIRPREFSLIRPTFLPPKPNVLAPINVKPVKQLPITSTNNNPRPTVFPSLRLTAVVPKGYQRQNMSFATRIYQPQNWVGAASVAPKPAGSLSSPIVSSSKSESGGGERRPSLDW
jgi:hypothetical protein